MRQAIRYYAYEIRYAIPSAAAVGLFLGCGAGALACTFGLGAIMGWC